MKRYLLTLVTVLVLMLVLVNAVLAAPAVMTPKAQTQAVALTPELLAAVFGVLLSLAASYIPKFRTWWAALPDDNKRLIMAVANILIGIAIYVLACTPSLGFPFVACPVGGFWYLVQVILLALISNQVTDRVSPDTQDVKAIKAAKQGTPAS